MEPRLRMLCVLWFLLVLGLLAGAWVVSTTRTVVAEEMVPVDNAVVFLADVSSSMDDEEKAILRGAHAQALMSSEVLSAIRAGAHQRSAFIYIEFASSPIVVVDWTIITDEFDAQSFAAQIMRNDPERPEARGGSTGIARALAFAAGALDRCPCIPLFKTVDVVGDGNNTDALGSTTLPRQLLISQGATINGLPMVLSPSENDVVSYYANHVVGGPRSFLLPIDAIAQLPMALRQKLILELF